MWSCELFLRAKHLKNTTSVKYAHSNEFKLVTDALLFTSKDSFLSKQNKPSGGGDSDPIFLCSGVKNGVKWA